MYMYVLMDFKLTNRRRSAGLPVERLRGRVGGRGGCGCGCGGVVEWGGEKKDNKYITIQRDVRIMPLSLLR
jgi:hypothetical protein